MKDKVANNVVDKQPSDLKNYAEVKAYAELKGYKPGWAYFYAKQRGFIR